MTSEGEPCSASEILMAGKLQEIPVSSELGCNNKEKNLKFCPLQKLINCPGSLSERTWGTNSSEADGPLVMLPEQSTGHGDSKAKILPTCTLNRGWGKKQNSSMLCPPTEPGPRPWTPEGSWMLYQLKPRLEDHKVALGCLAGRALEHEPRWAAPFFQWPQLTLCFCFSMPQFAHLRCKLCSL